MINTDIFFFLQIDVVEENLILGPSPGALSDVYFPGFPTMKHLKYEAVVKVGRVKVFDMASRNESMIIKVCNEENMDNYDLQEIGKDLLNKEIFVCWPHLSEARVISLFDRNYECNIEGLKKNDERKFEMQHKSLINQ